VEKEAAEDVPIEDVSDDRPEGAIDVEVVKIASDNLCRRPMVWMQQKLSRGSPLMATIMLGRRRCDFSSVGGGVM
jgi:hypothetical protein